MTRSALWWSIAATALVWIATPAQAQEAAAAATEEEASTPFELEIAVAAVSDYRFRGISLSDKDPALQPSVTLSHSSGLYGGIWASTVAENEGADVEVDYLVGFAPTVGGFDLDLNATYYSYPGAGDLDYWGFAATVAHAVGPDSVGATVAYTPRQGDTVLDRGLYYGINGELPLGPDSPFTLTASFGIEDNAFYHRKRDWSLGIAAEVEGFTLGLSYVDTARTGGDPLGGRGLVFSLGRTIATAL